MDEQVNQSPDDISFEENVQEVLHGLPQPIQDFLTGPERDAVTVKITQKHNLHADQAGRFQKAFLFMLMGIFSPEQFAKDLADVGISPETVRALANDVNEEVFKPLRAKEQAPESRPTPYVLPVQNSGEATLSQSTPLELSVNSPAKATPLQTPVAPVPPALTAIAASPVVPPPVAVASMQGDALQVSATKPVQYPYSGEASSRQNKDIPAPFLNTSFPQTQTVQTTPEHQDSYDGVTMRTMATDMMAVREHKDPEPVPYHSVTVPLPPQHVTPVAPAVAPAVPPRSAFAVSPPTVLPGQEPHPLIKEYSVDPYRETM